MSQDPVGSPNAIDAWRWAGLLVGPQEEGGHWSQGAQKDSTYQLLPSAAGLSQLFVKHQPLFVMTPIKFPVSCLTRGTQSKSRETDESTIDLLAVACPLPVDFRVSKSKLKA